MPQNLRNQKFKVMSVVYIGLQSHNYTPYVESVPNLDVDITQHFRTYLYIP
jgi:hypothetical protein